MSGVVITIASVIGRHIFINSKILVVRSIVSFYIHIFVQKKGFHNADFDIITKIFDLIIYNLHVLR